MVFEDLLPQFVSLPFTGEDFKIYLKNSAASGPYCMGLNGEHVWEALSCPCP